MKIKNSEIFNSYEALAVFLESGLSTRATFITTRAFKTVQPIYEDIMKTKENLLNKYAKLNKEGKFISNEKGLVEFETEENKKKYLKEIEELFIIENEIECSLININDLEKAEKSIPSKYIIAAEKFITE
jgi:hypothetical protein